MMQFFSYLFGFIYFLVLFLNFVLGRGGKDRGLKGGEGEMNGIGMRDMKSTKNQKGFFFLFKKYE